MLPHLRKCTSFAIEARARRFDDGIDVEAVERRFEDRFHEASQHRLDCGTPVDEILARYEVNRRAHQRAPDDFACIDGANEILAPKSFDPRPEADERRPRDLRLHARNPLDRSPNLHLLAMEKELAGEGRAIQRAKT